MNKMLLTMATLLLATTVSAKQHMQVKPLEWQAGGQTFSGFIVYDSSDNDKRPGLVMVPNWMGVNESAIEKAKHIAGDDYIVLVADVYAKNNRPANQQEAGKLAGSLRGDDRSALRERMIAAVNALQAQAKHLPLKADSIGAFGFCFGGSAVLELARSGIDGISGVVSLHGGLEAGTQSKTAARINTPVLVLNGAADPYVSNDAITALGKELDAAKADWQFVNFSGAVHCFAEADAGNDAASGCSYDERAAKRAFNMMDDFFDEVFKD